MERPRLVLAFSAVLFIALVSMSLELQAQVISPNSLFVSNSELHEVQDKDFVPLTDLLSKLERHFDVTFLFKDEIVTDKFVNSNMIQIGEKTGQELSKILDELELSFKQIDEETYVLFRKNSPFKTVILQEQVSGVVTDASTGESLPGVNILVKGTTIGTSTDADGEYELTVESLQDTLVFSYIGYQTEEIPINGRSQIDIELEPQALIGEDIVVVGYGTQRREDVTSAVSSVNSNDFRTTPTKDAASLIKGKMAGLNITEPSGDPREGSEIKLRGTTTLNASSEPLILIDGVPGDLNTVSPDNIESIDVLKDGSAAAIYGSRGSNGVILITTKTHREGQSPTIRYEGYTNFQQIKDTPNFLSAEGVRNANQQYDAGFIDYGYSTDWLDQILRDPISHNHDISLSGGDANTSYTAGLNFQDRKGIFKTSNNEFVRSRINVNHSMLDNKLTAGMSLNYNTQTFNYFNENAWYQALIRNPTDRVLNDDGNWQERFGGRNYYNPLPILEETVGETERRELRFNGNLSWNPIENLSFKILGALNRSTTLGGFAETFRHNSTTFDNLDGYANRDAFGTKDNLLEFTTNYENSVQEHTFNILGGYSYQSVTEEGFFADNRDFPTDAFAYNSLESGSGLQDGLANIGSDKSSYKLVGYFSRLNYNFDNRYMLMGSLRYEGNSKFGEDHKWGLFPAFSAGWRISNEEFMQDTEFISDLKIRIGFGVTGIAPSQPYLSLTSYGYEDFFYNTLEGEWVRGIQPVRNPNPNLKWERKEEINLGVDFSLIEDRLSGNIDLYQRTTKDLLFTYSVPSPPYLYDEILANVGEMENNGLEIHLEYAPVQNQDFTWNTGVNYSTNSNKLVRLSNEQFQTENNFFGTGFIAESVEGNTHRVDVGGEIGNFFGFKALDIDENGQWIIEGADGQPKPYTEFVYDDRQVIGNGVPDHNLSWNNTFTYKQFDLDILMSGAFGFQILNEMRLLYENTNYANQYNLLESAFDPVFGKTQLDNEWMFTDYYLEDGDYWKIDNVTFGYNFTNLTNPLLDYISNARIYFSAQNLYTFTGYSGLDPEVNIGGLSPGIESRDRYPTTRSFLLGIELQF
jgi:TonB-linked SusC/RagA family outer membrane protein